MKQADTKLKVFMSDKWLDDEEMLVYLNDFENGRNEKIILAVADSGTTARKRAIKKLKKVIKELELMDK
jgi:hypothetical protein